mmetsp:Transcript_118519/g.382625  ORF Transcript_118519/g.382625 Transcript_118519/m.382625 type:complete len:321 (-) Transcript_118519:135-1097(-)
MRGCGASSPQCAPPSCSWPGCCWTWRCHRGRLALAPGSMRPLGSHAAAAVVTALVLAAGAAPAGLLSTLTCGPGLRLGSPGLLSGTLLRLPLLLPLLCLLLGLLGLHLQLLGLPLHPLELLQLLLELVLGPLRRFATVASEALQALCEGPGPRLVLVLRFCGHRPATPMLGGLGDRPLAPQDVVDLLASAFGARRLVFQELGVAVLVLLILVKLLRSLVLLTMVHPQRLVQELVAVHVVDSQDRAPLVLEANKRKPLGLTTRPVPDEVHIHDLAELREHDDDVTLGEPHVETTDKDVSRVPELVVPRAVALKAFVQLDLP